MRWLRNLFGCGFLVVALLALPAEGAAPARVLLRAKAAADGTVQVTATVVDARGAPMAEVPLVFKARTAFGWLTLRETATDRDGTARVIFPSGYSPEEVAIEAGDEGQVRAVVSIGRREAVPPLVRPGRDALRAVSLQPGFISPYPVPLQVTVFSLILGGIWSIYGYVVWLLLRIRREALRNP